MADVSRRLLLRRHLLIWRARLSVPSLLAGRDEGRVVSWIAAINGGLAILVISVLAWLIDLPLLFPALGPSAFLLFSNPFSAAAAPRSVIVSHFAAIAAGVVVRSVVGLAWGAAVTLETGGWAVFASASWALAITCILLIRLSAPHAPACATGLIAALGLASDGWTMLGMAAGVVFLTAQAVVMNRFAGVRTPTWSSRLFDARSDGG
jgi:CBS domain-containing membrane protein